MISVLRRSGEIIDDEAWPLLADDAPLPESGCWTVGPAHLSAGLPPSARDLHLCLRLDNTVDVATLDLPTGRIERIELVFPSPADGRAYTQARVLREQLGYRGALRATGAVTRDTLWEMHRCGFDEFALRSDQDPAACRGEFARFSQVYQGAADGRETIRQRRRTAPAA